MDSLEWWLFAPRELLKLSASEGGEGSALDDDPEKGPILGCLLREKMEDFPLPDDRGALL